MSAATATTDYVVRRPFVVKTQKAGSRGRYDTFVVVMNPGRRRVSVHSYSSRDSALFAADNLNVSAMVKGYTDDPRPYAVRRAEAVALFEEEEGRAPGTRPSRR